VITVCQCLATGQWFSPGPPVSSTNKTDRHDTTEILLKVALNIIKQTNNLSLSHLTKPAGPYILMGDDLNAHNQSINGKEQTIKALLFQEGLHCMPG
jgi:hypothetical protein